MNNEIKSLNEKINKMRHEIENKFTKSDKYKEECEMKVKKYLRLLTDLNEQKAALDKDVKNVEYDYELVEAKVERHDNYSKFKQTKKNFE